MASEFVAASEAPAAARLKRGRKVRVGSMVIAAGHPIERCRFLADAGADIDRAVWIGSGLRAAFDPHDGAHAGGIAWPGLRIPDGRRLSVGVGPVNLHSPGAGNGVGELLCGERPERTRDAGAARVADRVGPGPAFLV